jgi:hypothetical protein
MTCIVISHIDVAMAAMRQNHDQRVRPALEGSRKEAGWCVTRFWTKYRPM